MATTNRGSREKAASNICERSELLRGLPNWGALAHCPASRLVGEPPANRANFEPKASRRGESEWGQSPPTRRASRRAKALAISNGCKDEDRAGVADDAFARLRKCPYGTVAQGEAVKPSKRARNVRQGGRRPT